MFTSFQFSITCAMCAMEQGLVSVATRRIVTMIYVQSAQYLNQSVLREKGSRKE